MATPVIFVSSTMADVAAMSFAEGLRDNDVVEAKNITPDMIGDLDFALTGSRKREPICLRGDNHIVVYQLDRELVEAMSSVDDSRMAEVADEWEIADIAGTIRLLSQLKLLAQKVLARNEQMMMLW
jgi:hypothetical protein